MEFNNIYNNFKINILKIINAKKYDNFILSEEKRSKLNHHLDVSEKDIELCIEDINNKLNKLDTTIYIENNQIQENMEFAKDKYNSDIENLENKKALELTELLEDFNISIAKVNADKDNYINQINTEIHNIEQAIKYEVYACDSNTNYYDNLIKKAQKRYDDYNTIIYNKIINIDSNQPKTPKFNVQRKKFLKIINHFKYVKAENVSEYDIADGNLFTSIMKEYSNPLDDIITSLEEHSHFQTRNDNLNVYLEEMQKTFNSDKNKIEKIKHEVSADYNRKLYNKNKEFNEYINSSKINNERKLKSIDKRIEKQKKEYLDESARISEEYVSHITNISNEINNLDKENKRLIDNYNREYYFTYYKTLFEYNNLVAQIKDKTGYSNDQHTKFEQKRLDNFEIKAYQQKLKSLKLKHDKYIEQLNSNIIQQINHNNYEITESNLYKTFDLNTSKIKHESYLKKSKLLKENIEKSSSNSYSINSIKHDKEIVNLRFNEYDNKRQELDYEIEKMEIEYRARRSKIEKKINKYKQLMDAYVDFVENDNALIKTINDNNHNTKLTIYYFEIRKNNILKEFNKNILNLAKERAIAIKNHRLMLYTHKIKHLNQTLNFYLEICDYKIKYYSDNYNLKEQYINSKYEAKINLIKNEFNRKKNIKAIMFERNTFRHDNLQSRHYSDFVFSFYTYINNLHTSMVLTLSDNVDLINNLNSIFIKFYSTIASTYYKTEQDNLEKRLNEIYYYKNSASIKKLNDEKTSITDYYTHKIKNITLINEKYHNSLVLFNSNNSKININKNNINKVKKRLVKDIKSNNNDIIRLTSELENKIKSIDTIILKNKRSSIIHYQNYHIFKKTMSKLFNSVIKNINNLENKAKNKDLSLVLEEHRTYIVETKLLVYKIFKNFTSNVEREFPKVSVHNTNNYNYYNNLYTEKEKKALIIYNKAYNKLIKEFNKNSKIPMDKSSRYDRNYKLFVKIHELKHNKLLIHYKGKIKKYRNDLVNKEIEYSKLISNIQNSNKKIVKRTKETQQKKTNDYISDIAAIRFNYNTEIIAIDRNKKTDLKALKAKYVEITDNLKSDKNNGITKCIKDIKIYDSKQKEIQRVYKRNSSNLDADLINDRVDQQIILSQKLKKLKHLFLKNKDLRDLEDDNYGFVTLNDYDDVTTKIE